MRRKLQNGADGAALAGVRRMGYQINYEPLKAGTTKDHEILLEIHMLAEENGVEDTDGTLANDVNDNVEGVYLDENHDPIPGAVVGGGSLPINAVGVEVTVYGIAPSFFGGLLGHDGYPVQATAAAALEYACGAGCVLPIAFESLPFELEEGKCYNIYTGDGAGNFGWLNWSLQKYPCIKGDECSSVCLADNLGPGYCYSGFIRVGDPISGGTGVVNDIKVQEALKYWIDTGEPVTVPVWNSDAGVVGSGCGSLGNDGLPQGAYYTLAGFAQVQILSFRLAQNRNPYPAEDIFDAEEECITLGSEPHDGNRISAMWLPWTEGSGGGCQAIGSVRAPRLIE
jgi:hypothetical protein